PHEKLAVRGYVEVLRHYREIVGIRRALRDRLLATPPDLFVGIDAPDFNLALEADLREQSAGRIRTVHFVCPSIWAWRPHRIEAIRRSADHVLCVFPFEPAILQSAGIDATYVGHPVAAVIPEHADRGAARRALGLAEDAPVLAVLPGSRASEIHYIAPTFMHAVAQLLRARPALQVVVPCVPGLRAAIERAAQDAGVAQRVQFVAGQSHAVLAACDLTLIASGTATLEAALFRRPMVIAYRMHWLSWQIMRRKRLQPWVGLPNILCGDFVVPELLQDAATPQALAHEVLQWLDAPQRMAAVQQRFAELHQQLRRDTAQLATDAIEKVLAR
ncbi:MAG: lipid-A-disaccharide synthase, partial [Betaproteobacteria bacterium]|nr:lipid-A-disaccharide synthase [Betaproteobacteria bacterium]